MELPTNSGDDGSDQVRRLQLLWPLSLTLGALVSGHLMRTESCQRRIASLILHEDALCRQVSVTQLAEIDHVFRLRLSSQARVLRPRGPVQILPSASQPPRFAEDKS